MQKSTTIISKGTKKFKTCHLCGEPITDIRVSYLAQKTGQADRKISEVKHLCIGCLATLGERAVAPKKFDRIIAACNRFLARPLVTERITVKTDA